ncbi:acyl-CoA thioesterase [Christiangramia salexigens]|uniref:4-hydroxybenzoyl-CoA thioesterase n=1 Tax=Christiangramia salexigens TaxID=1913577 RepID=A0A1L3J308_9FLAO|nr:thioesterase family protein [Christiangramia salexigens]APG59504.1 4-hydroxybenzoyl-CoA thioesterase [Christiangramia salexigens]
MSNNLLETELQLKVRFHECDSLKIVWHGNYLKYFEEGREDFGVKHKISYLDVERYGYATPVVKSLCEHKHPLKYGDHFIVRTSFENSPAAKLIYNYEILSGEKLICTGQTVQVFTDENSELVLYPPSFFLDWKKQMGLI